ncbi:hypothetical protein ACIPWF_23680 [Paenarthrobacter sp. NPDC089989]
MEFTTIWLDEGSESYFIACFGGLERCGANTSFRHAAVPIGFPAVSTWV